MSTQIKLRRDTYANWTSINPVLAEGEIGLVNNFADNNTRIKIGDGVTAWEDLDYFTTSQDLSGYVTDTELATALSDKQDKAVVVSGNTTAVNDGVYHNVANATYADPSPVEGKGFTVFVRNGTATVGGTAYATAGTIIKRVYHSGSGGWSNEVYTVDSVGTVTPVNTAITDNITVNELASRTQGQIDALKENEEVGLVRDEDFSSLSDWNAIAGVWSVSSGVLNIPNGSNNFTSNVLTSRYNGTNRGTKYECWTFEYYSYVIPTIGASSFGISVGLKSINANVKNSIAFRFCTDTTKKGLIEVYHNESTATIYAVTSAPLVITDGDVTDFTIRRIYNSFVITWRNINTSQTVTLHYNLPLNTSIVTPNYAVPVIYANGGATTLGRFVWTSNVLKNPDFLFIADSIGAGMLTDNISQRFKELFDNIAYEKSAYLAGAGDKIEDNNFSEVIAIAPRNLVVFCLSNNVGVGQITSTMLSNLSTFITNVNSGSLTFTYNTNMFIANVMPRNDIDVSSHNTALSGVYSDLIDTYVSFKNPSGTGIDPLKSRDGIHPNPEHEYLLCSIFFEYLKRKNKVNIKNQPKPYARYVFTQIGGTRFGNPGKAFAAVDISTHNNANQFRIGDVNLNSGLRLINVGLASWFADGFYYNGTQYIADRTSGASIYLQSGQMNFMSYTGATVGNSVNATGVNRASLFNNGRWEYYSNGQGVDVIDTGNQATRGLRVSQYSNTIDGAFINIQKTRSTSTSGGNTAVQNGDDIARIVFGGGDGTTKIQAFRVQVFVDGTVSSGVVPMSANFLTGNSSSPTRTLGLTALGSVLLGRTITTSSTDGFPYIPVTSGAPTGTPTAQSGLAPIQLDDTNNRIYVYIGGAWRYINLV